MAGRRRGYAAARSRSAGEAGGDLGELPGGLADAAAVFDYPAAGAGPVAVDRPERQPRDVVRVGSVADVGPDRRCGVLLLIGQPVHARDAHVRECGGIRPAEGVLQRILQPGGRILGVTGHVRPTTEVERHDGEHVDVGAQCGRLVDQTGAPGRRPAGAGTERDDGLDPRIVVLDDLQRAQGPVLHGPVFELVGVLDVDIDELEAVRVDHLLVGPRQCTGAAAVGPELVTAPAAEGYLHVTAGRPDRVDRLLVRSTGQWPGAVPLRYAPPAGEHERHRERLDPRR